VLWQGYTWTMYGVAVGNLVLLGMTLGRLWRVRRGAIAQLGSTAAAAP
jgi:hypothetical protein